MILPKEENKKIVIKVLFMTCSKNWFATYLDHPKHSENYDLIELS